MARWEKLKRWSRWAAECSSFAVLVWLMLPLLRDDYGFSRRATLGLVWWLATLFAVSLSVLQFPIVSRGLDTTDILFRLLGTGAGLLIHSWYARPHVRRDEVSGSSRRQRLAGIACTATAAYIVYTGVLPLVFEFGDDRVKKAVASPALLPFMGYFATRFDVMLTDVIEKCTAYATFAALLATSWPRIADRSLARKISAILPAGLILCALIECVQVFLPVRIPSLTDPLLAGFGCVVGVAAQAYAVDGWRFALTHELLGPRNRRGSAAMPQRLSLTDQLVGTLIDPNDNAPTERPPADHPARRN